MGNKIIVHPAIADWIVKHKNGDDSFYITYRRYGVELHDIQMSYEDEQQVDDPHFSDIVGEAWFCGYDVANIWYIVKLPEKYGVEPSYLQHLDTLSTVRGKYSAGYCLKNDPAIFRTQSKNTAQGLATIINGTVEEIQI